MENIRAKKTDYFFFLIELFKLCLTVESQIITLMRFSPYVDIICNKNNKGEGKDTNTVVRILPYFTNIYQYFNWQNIDFK